MRFRLIIEMDYPGAEEHEEQMIRDHLSSVVHATAESGMLEAEGVPALQVAAACERLADPEPDDNCGECGKDRSQHEDRDDSHEFEPFDTEPPLSEVGAVHRDKRSDPLTCAACFEPREVGEPCYCGDEYEDDHSAGADLGAFVDSRYPMDEGFDSVEVPDDDGEDSPL